MDAAALAAGAGEVPVAQRSRIELEIGGMTCASCANRIEKKLNRLDGVTASVNYATEKAVVSAPAGFDAGALIAEVEKTGYTAALPQPPASAAADPEDRELTSLRQRLIGAVVLSVPVIAMAMIPALQFTYWQWLSLALAAPVVVWAAWPFHRAAWINLRHGAATMDTLISIGVSAAFLWSLYALFFGGAGMPGMTHVYEWTVQPSDGAANIYLEVAAGVTMFVLAGRYFEVRSKRRAGAALRALLDIGAKDVAVLRDGDRGSHPDRGAAGRQRIRGAARREDRDRWRGRIGVVGSGRVDGERGIGPRRGRRRRPGDRGDGERRRAPRGARDACGRRHAAGSDGAARPGRAVGQGERAAPRGPHLGRVRADRDRDRGRHARGVAAAGLPARGRGDRRRRRPHHRLPVRPRSCHPDGAAGRDRPRRAARHPDQGSGDPGVDAQGRHDRARQDRDGHDRADDAGRRRDGRRRSRAAAAARWCARAGVRASDRPRRRPRGRG